MLQCQRCGGQNDATSRFCVQCGTPLQSRPSAAGGYPAAAPAPSVTAPPGPLAPNSAATTAADYAAVVTGRAAPNTAAPLSSLAADEAEPTGPAVEALRPPLQDRPPLSSNLGFAQTAPPVTPPPVLFSGTEAIPIDPSAMPDDAPRVICGFLVSFENDPLGQWWPLYQGKNVVGRQGAAAGLHIEINHPTTSSRHAVLFAAARPGRLVFEDTGSTNGSFLNNNYVPPGSRQPLRDGDAIRFGLFNASVKII